MTNIFDVIDLKTFNAFLQQDLDITSEIPKLLKHSIDIRNYELLELLANNLKGKGLSSEINNILHQAVESNDQKILEVLLKHELDLEITNEDEITPLYLATIRSYNSIVELLITHGAEVNVTDSNDVTLLHQAVLQNNSTIAKLLICKKTDLNPQDCYGFTPLHYAARKNLYQMAKLLAEEGADINTLDKALKTPLFLAINSPGEHVQVVALLCAIDAKIDLKDSRTSDYFNSNIDKLLEVGSINSSISMGLKILRACDSDTKSLSDYLAAELIKKIDSYAALLKSGHFINTFKSKDSEYIYRVLNKLYESSEDWEKLKNIFRDSKPKLYNSLKSLIHSTKIVKELDDKCLRQCIPQNGTLGPDIFEKMSATVKNLASLLVTQSFDDGDLLEIGEKSDGLGGRGRPTSINTKLRFSPNMLSIDIKPSFDTSALESKPLVSRLDCKKPKDLSPIGRKVRSHSPEPQTMKDFMFNTTSIVPDEHSTGTDEDLSKTLNIEDIIVQPHTSDNTIYNPDVPKLGNNT